VKEVKEAKEVKEVKEKRRGEWNAETAFA